MMPQWSDKYKLHHDLIDAQHKELFRLANFVYRLHPEKTTKQELAVILKSFYQYIQTHFKDKESYMESINYPLRKEHIKLHDEIIRSVNEIIQTKKTLAELRISMRFIAQKWLSEHILENDLKISLWKSHPEQDDRQTKNPIVNYEI